MKRSKNVPFKGDTKKIKGNIYSQYPNRKQRRYYLNALPNSTKVGKQGKGVNASIRSVKQMQEV